MRGLLRAITVSLIGSMAATVARGQESAPPPPAEPSEIITVAVLDESGAPGRGVAVGNFLMRSTDPEGKGEPILTFAAERQGDAVKTDDGGIARIDARLVFYKGGRERAMPIIAWDKEGGRIGLAKVEPKDMSGKVGVTLSPACRVTARLGSTGLERLGRKLDWSNVYVMWGTTRPMGIDAQNGVHEFPLPAGDYKLYAYGTDTDTDMPPLKILAGEKERTVEIDLPASRLAELMGKPAPELSQIKGWKNGGPVGLGDLVGKVVLLDFWGYWCGPCVHSMPELMEAHEKYKDRGLVIVAVHDDSVADIAEMEQKLTKARADVWGGKDLPFLVALDGGGETQIEGHAGKARGATTALYGIRSFPTTILIGRDGRVIGRMSRGNEGVEQLEKALAEGAPAK